VAGLGGQAAAADRSPSVQDRVKAYRQARARAGDFLLSPQQVVERLLSRRPPVVIDVRTAKRFAASHLRGARPVPLPTLLQRSRIDRVPRRTVVVVDEGGSDAIEAMVVLRLAGRDAFAMTGGMRALRRLLAKPPTAVEGSPAAGRRARALLVGSAADAQLRAAGGDPGWVGRTTVRLLAVLLVGLAVLLYVRPGWPGAGAARWCVPARSSRLTRTAPFPQPSSCSGPHWKRG
jgi:rhodanese-related sulfurtransferase